VALTDSYVKQEFTTADLEQERLNAYLEEAGLEGREVDKLRNTLLSPEEAVAAKHEQLTNVRQRRGRKTDWEEFVDVKRRMGRVLYYSEFTRCLRRIVPSLIVVHGAQRARLGLYTVWNMPADEIPDYRGKRRFVECPIYLGWVDEGYLPEYEIDRVNEIGVAVGQRRGWRTILLRMIARKDARGRPASIISERQAEEAFGWPTNGPTASNYRRQLWNFRNGF